MAASVASFLTRARVGQMVDVQNSIIDLLSLLHRFPIAQVEFEYLSVVLGVFIAGIIKVGHQNMIRDILHLITTETCCAGARNSYSAWSPLITVLEHTTDTDMFDM